MLTIVLSGPKASTSQMATALASNSLSVLDTERDHGLTPLANGEGDESIREAQGFVTVSSDDLDAAVRVASTLGWRLRLHYPAADPSSAAGEPLAVQMAGELAALKARIAVLEGKVA